MTKSELIVKLSDKYSHIPAKDVEGSIREMIDLMTEALATGGRIEIRGFGSFSLHHRAPRIGRNPKTGDLVRLDSRSVPHFKAGKDLRERVNETLHARSN